MLRRRSHALVGFTIALVLLLAGPCWCYSQQDEENMGRSYSKEMEQQVSIVKDGPLVERVQRVGATIAKIANENEVTARYGSSEIFKFNYQFKVVDDKDINAVSLPGGIVYVNSGLLEAVESDDELAGVLAHEVAHAAHHHMSQIMKKQSSADRYIALIALAGILTNMRSRDFNNLLFGAQLLKIGKTSSLTQEAEKDADRTAVTYLAKSSYKPEAMLTFMKKLDAKRDENPSLPLGIFQTHPAPFRRVVEIAQAMKDDGIQIDMRKVQDIAYAKSVPLKEGSKQYRVIVGKQVLYEPADLSSGPTSKERAETIAKHINDLLGSGKVIHRISSDSSGTRLIANDVEVLKVEDADAAMLNQTDRALLEKARSALSYAVWADWLCNSSQAVRGPAPSD